MMIEKIIHRVFETTAVLGPRGFQHFGITEMSASLYGDKAEDIQYLQVKVSQNQEMPPKHDNLNPEADYWAWYDKERDRLSLIYPKRFLLQMCFAYGMKIMEERGFGIACRVEIVTTEKKST